MGILAAILLAVFADGFSSSFFLDSFIPAFFSFLAMILIFSAGFYLITANQGQRAEKIKNALVSGFMLAWMFFCMNSSMIRLKPSTYQPLDHLLSSATSLIPLTCFLLLDDCLNFLLKRNANRWDFRLRIFTLIYLGVSFYVRVTPTDATAVLIAGTIVTIILSELFVFFKFRRAENGEKT
ncbi:MAG: hypothetical protein AB1403_04725 [Candidatus Riflebacteria bacterium]